MVLYFLLIMIVTWGDSYVLHRMYCICCETNQWIYFIFFKIKFHKSLFGCLLYHMCHFFVYKWTCVVIVPAYAASQF